jgi:hypothetical protein
VTARARQLIPQSICVWPPEKLDRLFDRIHRQRSRDDDQTRKSAARKIIKVLGSERGIFAGKLAVAPPFS